MPFFCSMSSPGMTPEERAKANRIVAGIIMVVVVVGFSFFVFQTQMKMANDYTEYCDKEFGEGNWHSVGTCEGPCLTPVYHCEEGES